MKRLLLLALAGASWMSAANILVNPGFEDPSIAPDTFKVFGIGSTAINGWTVTGSLCGVNCVLQIASNYTEPSNIGTIQFLPHGGTQAPDPPTTANTLLPRRTAEEEAAPVPGDGSPPPGSGS